MQFYSFLGMFIDRLLRYLIFIGIYKAAEAVVIIGYVGIK